MKKRKGIRTRKISFRETRATCLNMAKQIRAFDRLCQQTERTDLDQVWELLYSLRDVLDILGRGITVVRGSK